jgi:hypothetical protein
LKGGGKPPHSEGRYARSMRVVLFGGSGMVGQAVLRECLLDPEVERVVSVVRRATGAQHPKLHEVVHADFHDFISIAPELTGVDACLFPLGVTSAGMSEQEYRRVTYDITMAATTMLLRLNPQLTFVFVSGAGTDSTERGRVMWARVKGAAENTLAHAVQGGIHVPAGSNPTVAWGPLADDELSDRIRHHGAGAAGAQPTNASVHHDDGKARTSDDRGSEARSTEAVAGVEGHQRSTVFVTIYV